MSDQIEEAILQSFRQVAAGLPALSLAVDLPRALDRVTRAVTGLSAVSRPQESTASTVVNTVLKSGLGMVPLAQGVFKLFGGGGRSEPAPAPLVRYARPESIRLEGALWDGRLRAADYDQAGTLRPNIPPRGVAEPAGVVPRPQSPASAQAVVHVNVQAMDSRSFLDHSQEIARAVREAMLNLNPINDVVNDL